MKKIGFFIVFILLLLLRVQFLPKLDLKDGTLVRVTGILSDEPQISGNVQKFSIGQFAIITQRYPEYHYVDEVEATGELKTQISNVKTKTKILKLFTRLQNKYLLNFPKIEVRGVTEKKGIKRAAVWTRLKTKEVFKKIFPSPHDGIMSGVVIGDKSLIPADLWNKFKVTGTLHIMVASGSNIAMFSKGLLEFLCILFVRKISLFILICLIWFYTLISGFQPPIVRAAIMATVVYSSQIFGRLEERGRALWLTGAMMILISPIIVVDLGFQLSFLSTLGLVYVQPKLSSRASPDGHRDESRDLFPPKGKRKGFLHALRLVGMTVRKSDNFSSSLACFLATTPILLLNFGNVNLLSPIINLAVLWVIPFLLQTGMGLALIGLAGQIRPTGQIILKVLEVFSYLLYPLLYYLEKIVEIASKWTVFEVDLKVGLWWVIGYYFILCLIIRKKFHNPI